MSNVSSRVFELIVVDEDDNLRLMPDAVESLRADWVELAKNGEAEAAFRELLDVVHYFAKEHALVAAELFVALESFLPVLEKDQRQRASRRFLQTERRRAAHVDQARPEGSQRLGANVLPMVGARHIIR